MSSSFPITRAIFTEEGVYGLILVSGLVATAGSTGAPTWRTLLFTGVTVIVFWCAHVYAGAVAAHGAPDAEGEPTGLGAAIRRALWKSRGMLAVTVFPAIALLLGTVGLLDNSTSTWLALWACVGALALLGYVAYWRKGASLPVKLLGALATASFGIVIVVAKAVVAH